MRRCPLEGLSGIIIRIKTGLAIIRIGSYVVSVEDDVKTEAGNLGA